MNLYYVKYEALGIERECYIKGLNSSDVKKKLETALRIIINILNIERVD